MSHRALPGLFSLVAGLRLPWLWAKEGGSGLAWGGGYGLGCREGQVQMAPASWHNQGGMSGDLEEHLSYCGIGSVEEKG